MPSKIIRIKIIHKVPEPIGDICLCDLCSKIGVPENHQGFLLVVQKLNCLEAEDLGKHELVFQDAEAFFETLALVEEAEHHI